MKICISRFMKRAARVCDDLGRLDDLRNQFRAGIDAEGAVDGEMVEPGIG